MKIVCKIHTFSLWSTATQQKYTMKTALSSLAAVYSEAALVVYQKRIPIAKVANAHFNTKSPSMCVFYMQDTPIWRNYTSKSSTSCHVEQWQWSNQQLRSRIISLGII